MAIEDRIKKFVKPASSTKLSDETVKTISRVDIVKSNKALEPAILQNKTERKASLEEMLDKIVKD